MPTSWSAGEHDCKVFSTGGGRFLRCKCGWVRPLTAEECWGPGEPWRAIAAEHSAVAVATG